MALKTIDFKGVLYRADTKSYPANVNAFTAYSNNGNGRNFIKYFTKNVSEANIYAKQARHINHWKVKSGEVLRLIDILDLNTRTTLSTMSPSIAKSLDIAFPIKNGRVERYSNSNTTKNDYAVLKNICALGDYDGYYMEKTSSFHSEIGLCSKSLNKLIFVKRTSPTVPPNIGVRKTRKMNNNPNKTPRRPLFGMNENNTRANRRRTLRFNNGNNNMAGNTIATRSPVARSLF